MTIKIVSIPRLYGELKDKLYSRYEEVYTAGKQMWEGEYCVKCEDFLKQISCSRSCFLKCFVLQKNVKKYRFLRS